LLEQFVTLWVVIDPVGTIPVFIAVTAGMNSAERRATARQATLVSTGILAFFLVLGQILIDALGIGLHAFQVAGGIILFLFALTMIFGESKPETDQRSVDIGAKASSADMAPGIFPLGVPSLASPGAMLAIVILTDNHRYSIPEQSVTAAVMVVIMAIAYGLMRLAEPIIKIIGFAGAAIISRVMGMILAAVAANHVLAAILEIVKTGRL